MDGGYSLNLDTLLKDELLLQKKPSDGYNKTLKIMTPSPRVMVCRDAMASSDDAFIFKMFCFMCIIRMSKDTARLLTTMNCNEPQ